MAHLPKDAADAALLEPTKGHVKPSTMGVGEYLTRLQLVGHLGGPVFVARPNAATQPVPTPYIHSLAVSAEKGTVRQP